MNKELLKWADKKNAYDKVNITEDEVISIYHKLIMSKITSSLIIKS